MDKARWVATFGALISIIAGTLAFYVQFVDRQSAIQAERIATTEQELEDLSKRLTSELLPRLRAEIAAQGKSTTPIVAAEKLAAMEKRIEAVDNRTYALRQAINPTKPDEILTIARLTDEVKDIREDFVSFQKQLEARHQSFQSSILREIKSSNDSTNLILIVLLPLILNFLYTIWKDFKSAGNKD